MKETDSIRPNPPPKRALDDTDRRLLGVLVEDAGLSYAELGRRVALSAPAVHERVKRLRRDGVIKGISARLDGKAIGKPLLVFVHVVTQNWGHSEALHEIAQLPEVEEMHSATGDTSIILKLRLVDSEALEAMLRQIHALDSVVATKTFVTLSTYQERPIQAEITADWPDPPRPKG
ncbi:MAG: Lrp/AsnC family transcriptional regulator [Pseudomonadota bacterium]